METWGQNSEMLIKHHPLLIREQEIPSVWTWALSPARIRAARLC